MEEEGEAKGLKQQATINRMLSVGLLWVFFHCSQDQQAGNEPSTHRPIVSLSPANYSNYHHHYNHKTKHREWEGAEQNGKGGRTKNGARGCNQRSKETQGDASNGSKQRNIRPTATTTTTMPWAQARVRLHTWQTGADGDEGDGGDAVPDAEGAAEVRGDVPDEGREHANRPNGHHERSPPAPVVCRGGREEGRRAISRGQGAHGQGSYSQRSKFVMQ